MNSEVTVNSVINLFEIIEEEIKNQNIDFNLLENDNYSLESKNLDKVLEIIFQYSSSSEYCFSITRDEYEICKIDLYDKNSEDIKTFNIQVINTSDNGPTSLKKSLFRLKCNILKAIRIIPIIGPDGVGKTSLLLEVRTSINEKNIYKRFKKIVRRSIIYNILYPINKKILKKQMGKRPEKDQHDDKNSKLIITAGLIYYPYLILLSLIKNRLIFVDRFFQDAFLENISFKEKDTQLRTNWESTLKFIPTTFWFVHLDAKSDVIMQRKDELTIDDIDKYRSLNFEMYLKKSSVIYTYINTGNEISQCKRILIHAGEKSNIFEPQKKIDNEIC